MIGARDRNRPLAATAAAHDQPLLLIEAEQALVVHNEALPAQQDVQAPVAKAPAFIGQRLQPLAQSTIVRPLRPVAHHHPADIRQIPIIVHARRSLTSNFSRRRATASRLAAGVTIFLRAVPSVWGCWGPPGTHAVSLIVVVSHGEKSARLASINYMNLTGCVCRAGAAELALPARPRAARGELLNLRTSSFDTVVAA